VLRVATTVLKVAIMFRVSTIVLRVATTMLESCNNTLARTVASYGVATGMVFTQIGCWYFSSGVVTTTFRFVATTFPSPAYPENTLLVKNLMTRNNLT